jgi:uncharacterized protein (TIGR02246 family)
MKTILFLCIFLACFLEAHAQPKPANEAFPGVPKKHCVIAAEDTDLQQIAEQWKDGYNNGHASAVASLYAEDATYLTQHFVTGIVQGRAAIQAYVQRGVDARYHIDSIQVLSTICSGDFAYTIGPYESTNAGQKAFGVNLLVLRKIKGRWLIVAHESAVPDTATAIQHLDIPSTP